MAAVIEQEPTLRNGVPAYVEHRLERWGLETKSNPTGAWPSVTILGRMIDHGPGASAEGPQIVISDESAEIDYIVAKMPVRLRRVVEKEFKTWTPQEIKAKVLHMSLTSYKLELRCGLWWVYARLET